MILTLENQEIVRANHETFRILASTLADPDKWTIVLRLIGQLLSRIRGSIKVKVRRKSCGKTCQWSMCPTDALVARSLTSRFCLPSQSQNRGAGYSRAHKEDLLIGPAHRG